MSYTTKAKYTPLNDVDIDTLPQSLHPRQESRFNIILQLGIFLISGMTLITLILGPHSSAMSAQPPILSSAPAGGVAMGMNRVNPSIPKMLKPCGKTAAEAQAAGCIFDLLTLSWLHPSCYDADLTEEFMDVASETFYYDMEATRPIENYEILSERTEDSFTTRRYHIYHCAYGWRFMHRALERGGMLESGLSGYHHTEHCTDALMNTSIPLENVVTTVNIEFPDC